MVKDDDFNVFKEDSSNFLTSTDPLKNVQNFFVINIGLSVVLGFSLGILIFSEFYNYFQLGSIVALSFVLFAMLIFTVKIFGKNLNVLLKK